MRVLAVVIVMALMLFLLGWPCLRTARRMDATIRRERLQQNALDATYLDSLEARRRAERARAEHWLKR